jgi:short subunit dehydrogenase-like uncharacterized protein
MVMSARDPDERAIPHRIEPERAERELDIVLFGATGFVGRLVAGYLAEHAPPDCRIALAGRSASRLAAVRAELPAGARDWPLLLADSADEPALASLARSTRVVASTVGPYLRHGLPLVAACAEAGTHYADLTGEVLFARQSMQRYDDAARASGARIVHSCGFDSVPSDLGVMLLHRRAAEDDAGELGDTTSVVAWRGAASGGTIDSMRGQVDAALADPAVARAMADPFVLSPDRAGEPDRTGDLDRSPDSSTARRDERFGGWIGPFVMARFNTRIVRRSNALQGWAYGRRFRYREVVGFGPGLAAQAKARATGAGLAALMFAFARRPLRQAVDRVLPKPGQGPDEQARAAGYFRMRLHTVTSKDVGYVATVAAKGDPGYAATAVMIGESALALALDGAPAALPGGADPVAGVLTPATGIGLTLVERLRRADFTLQVDRVP